LNIKSSYIEQVKQYKYLGSIINDTKSIEEEVKERMAFGIKSYCKGKAVPLQAWTGPEGSRKLRFPDFVTRAQDEGRVVSLMHRPAFPPPPQEILLVLISVRGWVDPRAMVRSEGFYVN